MDVLARGQRPRDIITRAALENAIAGVAATGGSTNGVLHLLAIAREAGVELTIDDFDRIAAETPLLCDLKPGGRFVATDLYAAGGTALVGHAPARGRDAARGRADRHGPDDRRGRRRGRRRRPARRSCAPLAEPLKPTGGLVILRGNLAPEGCVVKLAGHERLHHRGPARVFDCEEDAMAAVTARQIRAGDVVVIRNEGPAGGPGMREMLAVTGGDRRRGARRLGRAAHRRPLLGRHARLHGRPRRARGGRAAARSPPSATATRS